MKKYIARTAVVLCGAMAMTCALAGCDNGKEVVAMMIQKQPEQLEYFEGELFDPEGMVLVVQYADGSAEEITSGYTWNVLTPLTEDDDEIRITYGGKSKIVEIDVETRAPVLLAVEEGKLEYYAGEKFDVKALKLRATYADGTSQVVSSGIRVTPSTALTTLDTEVTVFYRGVRLQLPVDVRNAALVGLELHAQPAKTTYDEGEYFETAGMEIWGQYADQTSKQIVDYDYSPKGALTAEDKEITVSWGEYTVKVPITVNELATKLVVQTSPAKSEYEKGELFDPSGLIVALVEDGVPKVLKSNEYTIAAAGEPLSIGAVVTVAYDKDDTHLTARVPVIVSETVDATTDMVTGAVGYSANATLNGTAVGGRYLVNFEEGSVLAVNIQSDSACKAELSLRSASTYVTEYSQEHIYWPTKMGDVQANKLFEVYVNNVPVPITDDVIFEGGSTEDPGGDVTLLAKWMNVTLAHVDLVEGANEIRFVFLKQIYKNADVTYMSGDKETTKVGVLSSPVVDTFTVRYGEI